MLVGAVTLWGGSVRRVIDTHLTTRNLRGWSLPARVHHWTDDDAVLPLGERAPNAIAMLASQVLTEGFYAAMLTPPQILH